MKRTFKVALSAVLGGVFVGSTLAQDPFPDVSNNHWAYRDLFHLKADGLLGFHDIIGTDRPQSRHDLAAMVLKAWVSLKAQQHDHKRQSDNIIRLLGKATAKSELDAFLPLLDAWQKEVAGMESDEVARMNRLIDGFHAELAELGADAFEMKSEIAGQFCDVPANHWASRDILELRANGILIGYPDGRFWGSGTVGHRL